MTNLHRFHYQPHELDEPVGPVPAFGNPGAIRPGSSESYQRRHCAIHDVRWNGNDDCWLCTDGAA